MRFEIPQNAIAVRLHERFRLGPGCSQMLVERLGGLVLARVQDPPDLTIGYPQLLTLAEQALRLHNLSPPIPAERPTHEERAEVEMLLPRQVVGVFLRELRARLPREVAEELFSKLPRELSSRAA